MDDFLRVKLRSQSYLDLLLNLTKYIYCITKQFFSLCHHHDKCPLAMVLGMIGGSPACRTGLALLCVNCGINQNINNICWFYVCG